MAGQGVHRFLRRVGVAVTLATLILPVAGVRSTQAVSTLRQVVAMYSDQGDWVGAGVARLYHDGNANISIAGTRAYLTVYFSGGTHGDSFDATFAAQPGSVLRRGWYPDAQRAPFRETGHPGIDISGDGRGCNTISGSFDVKEIGTRADGKVNRLWVTFEQHCEGGIAALFGEIRYGMDRRTTPGTLPWVIRWPDTYPHAFGTPSPLALLAPSDGSATVTDVDLVGVNANQFEVRSDECSGVQVPARRSCPVWVRFTPTSGGPKYARLVFHLASGALRAVKLEGYGIRGVTEFDLTSDQGDYIGQGLTYHYDPTNAILAGGGGRTIAWVGVSGNAGDWWGGTFQAPVGDILAEGTTYQATRYPFNNGGAGMDWSGNGRGCNQLSGWFAVDEISFTENDQVRYMKLRFEQHCEHATPALHGTLTYRLPAGDVSAPDPIHNLAADRDGQRFRVSWANPGNGDLAAIVVRHLAGSRAPSGPLTGVPTFAGTGTSVTVSVSGPTTFAVWSIDDAGNLSARRTITVTPP